MSNLPGMATYSIMVLTLMAAGTVSAQEVQWRYDYTAARREAKEKQRPIVMDFGTSNCFWCKKLDASTFRDPGIVRQLNEQFIPLKIDAEREPGLAQTLRIQSYPTLVFAAPDGRILGSHEGFVDVARFTQQLTRALKESASAPGVPTPLPSPRLAAAAAPAVPADQSRCIVRTTAPPAACDLPAPAPQARELLSLAQQDYGQRRFFSCLDRCTQLATVYPDSPEAAEARQLATRIKNDPALAQQLCEQLVDQAGELYLAQAESALRANDHQRAALYLERVVQVSPGTQNAQVARRYLDRLQGSLVSQPLPPKAVRGQSPQ
jgi:thioredoxin-related protein